MGGRFNSSCWGFAETARCDWPAFARCHLVPSPRVRRATSPSRWVFRSQLFAHPRRADAAPSRRAQRRARARRRSSRPARTRLSAARDPRRPAEPPRGAPRRAREVLGSPLAPVPFDDRYPSPPSPRPSRARSASVPTGARPTRETRDPTEKRAIYTTIARDGGSSTEKAHPYRDHPSGRVMDRSTDAQQIGSSVRRADGTAPYRLLASAWTPPPAPPRPRSHHHPPPRIPPLPSLSLLRVRQVTAARGRRVCPRAPPPREAPARA